MSKTMLFNPYTGKPRDPRDIASDPSGILMLDPDEPVRAAQPAAPAVVERRLIGWRTENYLWETNDIAKAQNWEPHVGVLPIFEGDPNTQLSTPPEGKQS